MNVNELAELKFEMDALISNLLGVRSARTKLCYPESPNPVLFFEIVVSCTIQGSFWANNEFRLDSLNSDETELIEKSGSAASRPEAMKEIREFLEKLDIEVRR